MTLIPVSSTAVPSHSFYCKHHTTPQHETQGIPFSQWGLKFPVFSSPFFSHINLYDPPGTFAPAADFDLARRAWEQEGVGLYSVAAREGVKALMLLTVVANLYHPELNVLTPQERERGLDRMILLGLDSLAAE